MNGFSLYIEPLVLQCLKNVLILTSNADCDEMQHYAAFHYAAFHPGLHCLPK